MYIFVCAQLQKNEKKKKEGEKKADGPPVTVVLKLDLHCEGCANKVKRSIRHFQGIIISLLIIYILHKFM